MCSFLKGELLAGEPSEGDFVPTMRAGEYFNRPEDLSWLLVQVIF